METVVALAHMVGRDQTVIKLFLAQLDLMEEYVRTMVHQLEHMEIVDVHANSFSLGNTAKLMIGNAQPVIMIMNARMVEIQLDQKTTVNASAPWDGKMITARHLSGVRNSTMV